jgi:hypothetical protein
MNKFSIWLNGKRGRATALGLVVGRKAASISNAKHGIRPIPQSWMDDIIEMSEGQLTLAALVGCNTDRLLRLKNSTAAC